MPDPNPSPRFQPSRLTEKTLDALMDAIDECYQPLVEAAPPPALWQAANDAAERHIRQAVAAALYVIEGEDAVEHFLEEAA